MIRRFVNIVAENYKSMAGTYSVYRLDVANHLFYPLRDDAQVMPLVAESSQADDATAAAAAGDEPPMKERLEDVPVSRMKIEAPPTDLCHKSTPAFVGLLSPRSGSDDKVVCMTSAGDALLCYADCNSTRFMPSLKDKVGIRSPIAVSVARPDQQEEDDDDLYLMHKLPERGAKTSCFHVLRSWRWEALPPPPFVDNPLYRADTIRSHTVVDGGRTICLSSNAQGIGTYCFDTAECEWRHAGDWMLPFDGRAEHVPHLNLWVGLSSIEPHCYLSGTFDLKNAMARDQPPKLQRVWQDVVTPQGWEATWMDLVNLGSGRFCVVRSFNVGRFLDQDQMCDWETDYDLVVLTGVEVGKQDEGVQAWKHRSLLYQSMEILAVL